MTAIWKPVRRVSARVCTTRGNSYLTADELAYILTNSESQILITSAAKLEVAQEAVAQCAAVKLVLVVGAAELELAEGFEDYASACSGFQKHRLPTNCWEHPCSIHPVPPAGPRVLFARCLPSPRQTAANIRLSGGAVALPRRHGLSSPAPLYHSAPQAAVNLTIRHGGTVIIMERFDPQEYLALIERYQVSHSQLVPTMFSRMLKLPETQRLAHDLSSLEIAIHAAAPVRLW